MNPPLNPAADSLITTFGLGRCRPAPGTWGSLPPVLLAAALLTFGVSGDSLLFGLIMAAVAGLYTGVCIRFGDRAAATYGKVDASEIVADETAAMALVLAFLPAGSTATPALAAVTLILAFLAFRAFDILKVFPADRLQELPGAWGVYLDDIAAALYTLIVLYVATAVL